MWPNYANMTVAPELYEHLHPLCSQHSQAVCRRCCCSPLGSASLLCREIQLFSRPRRSMGKSTDFCALVLGSTPLNENENPSLKKAHRKCRVLGLAAAESVLELPSLEGLVSPHSYVTSRSDHGQDLGSAFPPPPAFYTLLALWWRYSCPRILREELGIRLLT